MASAKEDTVSLRNGLFRDASKAWQRNLAFRVMAFTEAAALIAVLVGVTVYFVIPDREHLWAAESLDGIVTAGIASIGVLIALAIMSWLIFPRSILLRRFRRLLNHWLGPAIIVLTFFAGYAAFRNQGRLSAEASLNAAGYDLYNLEMSHGEIRCIYFNYGHERASECLETITSDADAWSFAIFYVEEGWFQLTQAHVERDEWGSKVDEQLEYWAQDVSRDPTGLFAYYLVSSEKSLADAKRTMSDAGVNILDICGRYKAVWRALQRHAAQPSRVSIAAKECARQSPADQSILAAETLLIES